MNPRPCCASRRGFLTVGALTGVGLSLGDFFRLREAKPRRRTTTSSRPRPRASSISSCRAASPIRNRSIPSPTLRSNIAASWEPIPTKMPGEVFCETLPQHGPDRRQDHGHPFDVARRGGPRARHAQHVHRLSAQPGARSFPAWGAWSATNTARATICRRTFAFPNQPNEFAGHRLFELVVRPVQLGCRSGQQGLQGPRPELARGRRRGALCPPPLGPGRGERAFRRDREVRRARRRWTRSTSGPTA